MQSEHNRQKPSENAANGQGRSAPQGMPREVAMQGRAPRQLEQKRDQLPAQKPVTDDVETLRPPSKLRILLKRIFAVLLLGIALSMAYIFLLLGEPNVEAPPETTVQEETIHVPMAAMEGAGNTDLSIVGANFGKPLLVLYGDALSLQKVTLSDTAFQGGYARRASLSYVFEDGTYLTLESIRPTMAAELLKTGQSQLYAGSTYYMAGLNAARMDVGNNVCIFAKSQEAVYAITLPKSHLAEVSALIKQTTLLEAKAEGS